MVPRSTTATLFLAVTGNPRLGWIEGRAPLGETLVHPHPDRIVVACEEVGVVRMQALEALPRAANATRGTGPLMIGGQAFLALRGVTAMQCRHQFSRNLSLRPLHPLLGFQSSDYPVQRTVGQPIASRHRPTGVQKGPVLDDDRASVASSDYDVESAERSATQQAGHQLLITWSHDPVTGIG